MTQKDERPVGEDQAPTKIDNLPPTATDSDVTSRSHIPEWLQLRLADHQRRREQDRAGRAEFAENRAHGLKARHAARLRHLGQWEDENSPVTVPPHGSPAWYTLPCDDPRRILADLVHDARCWRTLRESPVVAELIDIWREWHDRLQVRETSWAISGAADWAAESRHLSYRELARRRRVVSVLACNVCGTATEVVHPIPREHFAALPCTDWVRCSEHQEAA